MAIYASETGKSNSNLAHKLDVVHHGCQRKLLKILWPDHVTNDEMRQKSLQRKLNEIVKEHLKMQKGEDQSPPGEEHYKTCKTWGLVRKSPRLKLLTESNGELLLPSVPTGTGGTN